MFCTFVLLMWDLDKQDLMRIEANALHTTQWKRLQIAIVLGQKISKISLLFCYLLSSLVLISDAFPETDETV